jgi:deazaflavin-dependent oxidoreductase (nitroreductase family)
VAVAGPSRALRALFRIPAWLYRAGGGWILRKRFLEVTHRGRRSGRARVTVLEVIAFDPDTNESVVVSAYGPIADWYRNLQASPATRVRTGRLDYTPEQRFLSEVEARDTAKEFCQVHRWEARVLIRVFSGIGADLDRTSSSPIDVLARLPMVALKPKR